MLGARFTSLPTDAAAELGAPHPSTHVSDPLTTKAGHFISAEEKSVPSRLSVELSHLCWCELKIKQVDVFLKILLVLGLSGECCVALQDPF
jgi:hypothetical protein